jgi:predicted enzyme related to lactoylglutathione lyase
MHKSRLAGFIIDCQTDDLDAAAKFWTEALGFRSAASQSEEDTLYRNLDTGPVGLHVELQKVSHPSRVHLDIESDDVDAEAARLEKLGAKRIQKVRTWWVMEAPTGQRFCVVRPQTADFASTANEWS